MTAVHTNDNKTANYFQDRKFQLCSLKSDCNYYSEIILLLAIQIR